jgi:LacI family transcriptional regulator
MRDVAALAGVSLKTVSRVVNGEPGVSERLAARVTKAMTQLDYRHNLAASNLRRSDRRTGTLGLLVEDVANPFFADIHRGVEDVAQVRGAVVMASSLDRDPEAERDMVAAFASRRVDGLILGPTSRDQSHLANELRSGWPVVCVDRLPHGVEVDVVLTNNKEATATGVGHLLDQGHRRVAFLGRDYRISTAQDRHAGYLAAMAAAGAAVRPEWVAFDVADIEPSEVEVRRLMALPEPPTAIFAAQNLLTMGAVRALRSLGLNRRVALVGFDDFLLADLLEPEVTVVAQNPRAIGHVAAEILFRRMEDATVVPERHVIPSRLVIRGSGEIPPEA